MPNPFINNICAVLAFQYSMVSGSSPAGGPVVPGPPFEIGDPHFTFGLTVAEYIQYCILKMWPPFWYLAPPAAKSWRRACMVHMEFQGSRLHRRANRLIADKHESIHFAQLQAAWHAAMAFFNSTIFLQCGRTPA